MTRAPKKPLTDFPVGSEVEWGPAFGSGTGVVVRYDPEREWLFIEVHGAKKVRREGKMVAAQSIFDRSDAHVSDLRLRRSKP